MGERNSLEIEVLRLVRIIYKKIGIIFLAGLLSAVIVLGGTKFLITPKYEAMSTILVLTKETTLASIADLQLSSQLTQDYALLINSRPVLQKVIDNLELDITYKELKKLVTVNYLSDSRVLTITVVQDSPLAAKEVVDELASVGAKFIGEQMEVNNPKIIEDGEIPDEQSSPDLIKNGVVGFISGIILFVLVICIREIMNDTLMTEEEVEQYIGGAVLAIVPDVSTTKKSKKSKKKVRKR